MADSTSSAPSDGNGGADGNDGEPDDEARVDADELWLLSYYAASELAGGLLLGRMARWTEDAQLRARLTWHCAEETRHAWEWTETILKLGAAPQLVRDTYQSRYFTQVGMPRNNIELLAITQLFEHRVAAHFTAHLRRPDVHPLVRQTLQRLIHDEGQHIHWVRDQLDRWAAEGQAEQVRQALDRFAEIERNVYEHELRMFEQRPGELASFAARLRESLGGPSDGAV
jgi:bacterioferritin (cytochrome b1)